MWSQIRLRKVGIQIIYLQIIHTQKKKFMKKAMFILSTVLLITLLSSCSKDEVTVKKNWIFTITMVTTTTPESLGVPVATTSTTQEQDNLTEVEAEAARLALEKQNPTISQTLYGMTQTITFTVTKAEKK